MAVSMRELGSVVLDTSGDRLDARWSDSTGTERDALTILR